MRTRSDSNRLMRLSQIQHFLHKNPNGLTTKELARLCDTNVRTVQRDLLVLQADMHVPLIKKHHDRYVIIKDYILPPVTCSLYEALVLFLAARLIIRQTDDYNPHMRSALAKLAALLPRNLAIPLGNGIAATRKRLVDIEELHNFETIAIAWVTQKRVRIKYHSLKDAEEKEWLVNPYFIEMTGVGFSTYVIGYAENEGEKRIYPFKLNRIKEVTVSDENFETPPDLSLEKLLGASWGIMWGEEAEVKLRFTAGVARRVKESIWHPSQRIEDLADGGCVLTMCVGSTLEITPWIRGWGPDVEVLEPAELREKFKEWANKAYEMYRV